MSKILLFGCSLTSRHDLTLEYESLGLVTENYSQEGGSNNLQKMRYDELLINNQISEDDIIVWQITSIRRYTYRMNDQTPDLKNLNSKKNIFDKKIHHDIIFNDVLFTKKINEFQNLKYEINPTQELQSILAHLILVSKFNKKLLVVFGWAGALGEYMEIFKEYLDMHQIKYVNQPMADWVVIQDLPMEDSLHPTNESYRIWARNQTLPIIRENGWAK